MKRRLAICTLPLLAVTCCKSIPDTLPPPVAQNPAPVATEAPPPPPPAVTLGEPEIEKWLDAPQTPGDWTYRDGTQLSYATFARAGQPAQFGIECSKPTGNVRLVRGARADGPVAVRIRTETAQRTVQAIPSSDGRPKLMVTLTANDRLLDAIALSRGRFSVETAGLNALYLPAWPEITRVIEDCR